MDAQKKHKNVMLVLSTTRQSPQAVEEAIATARAENAELLVLFVNDAQVADTILGRMAEYDFIGEKPSEELSTAVMREYCLRGNSLLDEIEARAKSEGIPCRTIIEGGEFVEACLKVVERHLVDLIIVNRYRRSALSRLFLGSAVDKLAANAPCPVRIIEEA